MLIIDEQILSPILIKTALSHHIPIYYTDDERSLPLKEHSKVLTNSESCLNLLEKNDPNHSHAEASRLVKNKAKFREVSASINDQYFYRLVSLEELFDLDYTSLSYPLVIKPNRGYSSVGVHIVKSEEDWDEAVRGLYSELLLLKGMYSDAVVDHEQIIIEGWIEGEEFALDCYYDKNGDPVILNALKRRFVNDQDTSDRIYFTSSSVVDEIHKEAEVYLKSLNEHLGFKNYPFHIEVRKSKSGIIPIEMNPLRFAGVGTTDVSYHAYGINAAEAYFLDEMPVWEPLIERADKAIYGFFCAEVPSHISRSLVVEIDHDRLKKEFSDILEYRSIESINDRTFAVIFFRTNRMDEIDDLLKLDLEPYIKLKETKEIAK